MSVDFRSVMRVEGRPRRMLRDIRKFTHLQQISGDNGRGPNFHPVVVLSTYFVVLST
jgi:hypothetical protein